MNHENGVGMRMNDLGQIENNMFDPMFVDWTSTPSHSGQHNPPAGLDDFFHGGDVGLPG